MGSVTGPCSFLLSTKIQIAWFWAQIFQLFVVRDHKQISLLIISEFHEVNQLLFDLKLLDKLSSVYLLSLSEIISLGYFD